MQPSERVAVTLAAMDNAPASGIITALREALEEHWAVHDVRLLLVDYQFSVLQPIEQPERSVSVEGTPAGRAFTAQQPVVASAEVGGVPVWWPVTVRGERLGVLQFHLPIAPGAEEHQELTQLATAVGYALAVAGKETDVYRQAARAQRLTLAAELLWQLLPGRAFAAAEFSIAGQLEPAYHVGGDNFDWSCSLDHLQLSVCDGNGVGGPAALLTTLAVTAIRNARRAGLNLADQACLADQAIYAHHTGRRSLQVLLLEIDLGTGLVKVVDAGSPQLLLLRDNTTELVELDAQLPLGMFDGTSYTEQAIQLRPGDRLIILSDGVHAALSPHQETFGSAKLQRAIHATEGQSPGETVRSLISGLRDHHEGTDLQDDAVVVCLDWIAVRPTPATR